MVGVTGVLGTGRDLAFGRCSRAGRMELRTVDYVMVRMVGHGQ